MDPQEPRGPLAEANPEERARHFLQRKPVMIATSRLPLDNVLDIGPETNVACVTDGRSGFPREVIYESAYVRVIHQFSPSDEVIVTFNEIGHCADGLTFWGEAALSREGVGAIGVMSVTPNWFPADPRMAEAIRQVVRRCGYRRLTTYGYSQGGYGALKYSSSLSADTAISLCPQWSINPSEVSGFDDRFAHYYNPELHDGMRIDDGDVVADAYILFDPHLREDACHAARIAKNVTFTPVLTPFVGHSAAKFAAHSGIGRSLLCALRDPTSGPAARASRARRLVRGARGQYVGYWLGRATILAPIPHRREQALASAHHAARLAKEEAEPLAELAHVHLQLGDPDQVTAFARAAASLVDPRLIHTVLRIWDALDRSGNGALSLDMMRASTVANPDSAFLRLHLVKTLLDQRSALTREAVEQAKLAVLNAGPSRMLWQHLEHAFDVLGQVEDRAVAREYLTSLERGQAMTTQEDQHAE